MPQYKMTRGTTLVLQSTFFRGVDALGNRKRISLAGPIPNVVGSNVMIWFTAKRNLNDSDAAAAIQVMYPMYIAIVGPPEDATVQIAVPPAMTVAFPSVDVPLSYDIKVREQDGRESTVERGVLTVEPTATMST